MGLITWPTTTTFMTTMANSEEIQRRAVTELALTAMAGSFTHVLIMYTTKLG